MENPLISSNTLILLHANLIGTCFHDEAVQFIDKFFITKLSKPNIVFSPLKCDFSAIPMKPSSLFSETNTQFFSLFWAGLFLGVFLSCTYGIF